MSRSRRSKKKKNRELSACPFCDDASGACDHVVTSRDGRADPLSIVPEWNDLDEIAHDLDHLTLEGPATLDGLVGHPKWWWLTKASEGEGSSRRIVDAAKIAERFGLAAQTDEDDEATGLLFAEDPKAAATRMQTALSGALRELRFVSRRLGLDELSPPTPPDPR